MTPEARRIYDEEPGLRPYLLDLQYYDLSRVTALIETMAVEYIASKYPLFETADLPASSVCFRVLDYEIVAWRESDFRCADVLKASQMRFMVSKVVRICTDQRERIEREAPHLLRHLQESQAALAKDDDRRKEFRVRPGDIGAHPVIFLVSLCCDLIAQQNLFIEVDPTIPRPFRRRLNHAGNAMPVHRVIDFARSVTVGHRCLDEPSHHKALHFCSGHWRRSEGPRSKLVNGERRTWIDGHWRGDPALGVVTKTYVAGRKFLAAMVDASRVPA